MLRFLLSRYWLIHSLLCPRFIIKLLRKRWYNHPNYELTKGTRASCLRDATYAFLTGQKQLFNLEINAYKNWPINTIHIKEHIDFLNTLK